VTREAFGQRIIDMQASLFRVAYGILLNHSDCEDAVQESIVKAWQRLDRLRDEALLRTWVTRILINECYNHMRKNRRIVYMHTVPEGAIPPPGADAELHDAIASLSEPLRLPVVLHYMEGYRVDEIAGLLKCPTGTVKSRLRKARAILAELLADEERKVGVSCKGAI